MVELDTITPETGYRRTIGVSAVGGRAWVDWRRGLRLVTLPVRFVAFWAAVGLPFVYLPLLLDGLTGGEVLAFMELLCLNVVALVAGHGYGRG